MGFVGCRWIAGIARRVQRMVCQASAFFFLRFEGMKMNERTVIALMSGIIASWWWWWYVSRLWVRFSSKAYDTEFFLTAIGDNVKIMFCKQTEGSN
jgi:hypothetical protein